MKLASKISFVIAASCLLTLASCKKDPIVLPEGNDPVFTLEGTLGTSELNLVAGDDNAYMYTSTKLDNGVRVFSGELSDGSTSVELGIYDGNVDKPNHSPEIDLENLLLQFAKRSTEPLVVLSKYYLDSTGNSIENITWIINGLEQPSDEFLIREPGKYNVCARIKFFGDPGFHVLCDEIIVGYERNANFSINILNELNTIHASLDTFGYPISNVAWYLDNNLLSGNTTTLPSFNSSTTNPQVLKAVVEFQNGTIREKSCLIGGQSNSFHSPDFTVFEEQTTTNIVPQDYKVRLNIIKNGVAYKSAYANNENATIEVLSLEQYGNNSSGNKVFKALVEINAVVMEMTTEKLIPVNFISSIGIEIP